MNDLMGLIYTGDNGDRMNELTALRAVAAVPVCSRYRVIDFLLSSLVAGGARNAEKLPQPDGPSGQRQGMGPAW